MRLEKRYASTPARGVEEGTGRARGVEEGTGRARGVEGGRGGEGTHF